MPTAADKSESPLKILHVANGYLYGGVETALVTMARRREVCPRMAQEFALCFDGRLANELREVKVPTQLIGDGPGVISRKAPELRNGLSRILDAGAYDAVICHMLMVQALFGALARERGIPNFLYTHGATPPVWEWWASQVPPDHVIYNSRHMKMTSEHLFPDVPGTVIYYPAVSSDTCLDSASRKSLREANGAGEGALVIVHVARLEPMKGHRELLRAVADLQDLDNWVVWMIGGPQRDTEHAYLEELKDLSRSTGIDDRVRFLGQRSDVALLLRAADILCQPNLKTESFGMSYIEAEFAGLPVVTTAFGGALEAVGEGCGILTPPNDLPALTNALREFLTDPGLREGARKAGPAHAARLCDPAKNLNRLYNVVRREVESSRLSPSRDHSASRRTSPGVNSTDRATDTDSTR